MQSSPKESDVRLPGLPPEPSRYPLLQIFGASRSPLGTLLLFWVALIPPALGFVGTAVGYELLRSPWSAATGLVTGLLVGGLFARDFLQWRLRWYSIAACISFGVAFGLAYW